MDNATVNNYVGDMKNGANFPAVTVFYDGADYWLADGFHRLEASISASASVSIHIPKCVPPII
jgi:hypothetical protein